jgi:HK97 gp10 family phage protein
MANGAKKHSDRLKRMIARTPQEVARALYSAGQLVELDAERSITTGAVSGAGHVPSLPGEAPNADTHFLDSNIETEIGGPGLVTVTSKAPYSAFLEYGTSRASPRPFMRPAVERNRKKIVQLVGDAVGITIK